MAIFLFFFSEEIIQLVFQRGAFNSDSTFLTAKPLAIYSLGMLAFAIETVLVVAYFAVSDTKTPVFIGIICVIINILITWFLIHYISYSGIAWGLVISKTIKVIILLYLFDNKLIKND
jgi:putative peptidoglycan lipid II flippase